MSKKESVATEVAKTKEATEAKAAAKGSSGPKVAEGRSITSRRNILGPGTVVTEKDFRNGKEAIAAGLKNGTLVK